MKEKTKTSLTTSIITLIFIALLGLPITQGTYPQTNTIITNSPTWTTESSSPYILNYAVGVTAAGDSIYIANSATSPLSTRYFMRYNTSTSQWSTLSTPWAYLKNSIAMAWDKGNYIYALPGASYADITDRGGRFYFYRYNITSNSWTQLADTPHTNGPGDALCFVPGWVLGDSNNNFLYAILGSNEILSNETLSGSKFYRYNITSNSWSSPLNFPWSSTDDGCSLVWTGNNYLYALRGEWHETNPCYDFRRYNITGDTWESRTDIPAYPYGGGSGGVGDGGSLLWIGGNFSDYIYALSGNQAYPEPIWDKRFYRYTISTNTWESLADLPAGVGDQNGPRLAFANGKIYCWRGCNNDDDLYAYQLEIPPEITIISPENKTYCASSVPLTFTVNKPTSWMGYSLDSQENTTITGNTTLTGLSDEVHTIIVYANDTAGKMGSSSKVYFTIDTTPPVITILSPQNKTYHATSVPLTFTVNELTSWTGYSLDNQANETITGNTTLTSLTNDSHNIIVYARDHADNEGASEKVYFTTSSPIHNFTLVTLYIVHLELNETFSEGSNLTVIFYNYMGEQEANTTLCSTNPPDINLTINITHPLDKPVENATLALTDDTGAIICTITSFIVSRPTLMERASEIDIKWTYAPEEERNILFKEIIDIDFQWPYAPP